ncbi:hypothetical protein ACLKA6_000265 [Drosophila palustris]
MLSKPIISSCATAIIILACCGVIWISLRCWRYRTASNKDVDLESAAKSTEDGPHLPVGGVNTSNIAATNGSPRPDGKCASVSKYLQLNGQKYPLVCRETLTLRSAGQCNGLLEAA